MFIFEIVDHDELHKIFQDLTSSESENEKDEVNVEDVDEVRRISIYFLDRSSELQV